MAGSPAVPAARHTEAVDHTVAADRTEFAAVRTEVAAGHIAVAAGHIEAVVRTVPVGELHIDPVGEHRIVVADHMEAAGRTAHLAEELRIALEELHMVAGHPVVGIPSHPSCRSLSR